MRNAAEGLSLPNPPIAVGPWPALGYGVPGTGPKAPLPFSVRKETLSDPAFATTMEPVVPLGPGR